MRAVRLRLAIAAIFAAILVAYGAIDPADPKWDGFDLHRYEAMRRAAPHLAFVRQPEAFRLAAPFLAALVGFRTVAWTALAGCAALLFRWLRGEGIAEDAAAIAVVLFALAKGPVGQIAWNPWQAGDALGLLALLAALLALAARRRAIFGAAIAAGVLMRETPLLAIAPALVVDRRAILACAPAALVVIATRIFVPHDGGMTPWEAAIFFAPAKLAPEPIARAVGAFAPAIAVAIVDRRARVLRAEHWALVAATFASSLCGADVERLLLPMAPIVFLVIARAVETWSTRARVALFAAAIVGALHHEMGIVRLPSARATMIATLGSTAFAAAIALWETHARAPLRAKRTQTAVND